ncbi:MAG TPA: tetratricopeptide repeat protein [Arcobacter sp.]|nr:tetratricopeptide repeat protein [Arcobacter sp.]
MLKHILPLISIVTLSSSISCEKIEFEEHYNGEYCVYQENHKTILYDIIIYGSEKYTVSFHGQRGTFLQKKKTNIKKELALFNIENHSVDIYPMHIKKAYKELVKTLKRVQKNPGLLDEYQFYNLVYENGIHDKTVQKINDLAYYYALKNPKSKLLIKIYQDILSIYPNRTVAYYNLADAYWALGDKKKAITSYKTYIQQMKEKGKTKRIPKVVWDRATTKL